MIFVLYKLLKQQLRYFFVRLLNIYKPVRLKKQSIVAVLCIMVSLIGFFNVLNAQDGYGWDREYGGNNGPEEFDDIIQTEDRGFVMVGSSNSFGNANQIYIVRTDVDGKVLWTTQYGGASNEIGTGITLASNGGFIVIGNGSNLGSGGGKDIVVLHLDDDGNIINQEIISTNKDEEAFDISRASDGGYILTGSEKENTDEEDLLLVKLNSNLIEDWRNTFDGGANLRDKGNAVVETTSGDFVATGWTDIGPSVSIFVIRTNSQGFEEGNQQFSLGQTFHEGKDIVLAPDGTIFITGDIGTNSKIAFLRIPEVGSSSLTSIDTGNNFADKGNAITLAQDGNLVIAGITEKDAVNIDILLLKVSTEGDPIWQESHGQELGASSGYAEFGRAVVETFDGGFAIGGARAKGIFLNDYQYYLIKTDKNGQTLTNHIVGNAFRDMNNDCVMQSNEEGVRNWIVEAKGEKTYYGSVDANGNFDVLTDTGEYVLNIIRPNLYWSSCQPIDLTINLDNKYDTLYIDYPIQPMIDCVQPEVDISTPRIIPCEENIYRIDYCNHGTLPMIGAEVEVILDKRFNYNSSTGFLVSQVDSLYTFDVGLVNIGDCGFFEINVTPDCNTTVAGETHCVEARIKPNESCLAPNPNWDGSSLEVSNYCDGDEVVFSIRNVGTGDMGTGSVYIVVEDWVMLFEGQPQDLPQLAVGATQEIRLPANGSTYRLIAQQPDDHPGRNLFSTSAIESCDPNNVGATLTAVNQFEEDDRDPTVSISCQVNKIAFDPSELQAYPKGYKDTCTMSTDFKITSQTDLEYHIRFQNVGMDTLGNVVVRDTIPSHLDVTSIRPGAASHPYTFEAYGTGWVKFTFPNLELPNNTSNELLSHGFVKYRVSQKPGNPVGTLIEHDDALIYELYEAPKVTNGMTHLVGGETYFDFVCVITDIDNPDFPNVEIKVYPNPFTEIAKIEVTGIDFKTLNLHVFDMAGKELRTETFDSNSFEFQRGNLAQGMYTFTLENEGTIIKTGKIIIQ